MSQLIKSSDKMHSGMPELDIGSDKATSFFEFWPSQIIYIPIVMQWLWLAIRYRSLTLPLISNPSIYLGGMVGESKTSVLELVGEPSKKYVAPYTSLINDDAQSLKDRTHDALDLMQSKNLNFPVIAKPDLGCRGAGVKIIRNKQELTNYITVFPVQARYLLQEKVPYEAEAGIFYKRHPGKTGGEIFSITLKYAPYVVGDGKQNLRQLILKDARARKISQLYFERHSNMLDIIIPEQQAFRLTFAGSHSRGSIFRNGHQYISNQLLETFDKISSDIKGFYYGRIDVRFESIEKLIVGEDFKILEINGASSEAAHIWDRNTSIGEVYKTLFYQYKTLFRIGNNLRLQGHKTPSIWQLLSAWRKESKLVKQYPEMD